MRASIGVAIAAMSVSLTGCASYHQEVAAMRMVRPNDEAGLTDYAAGRDDYPSVRGDILKDTPPRGVSAYEATRGDNVPPAPR
ncbi:MAG TPA: hypothetical protein VMT68_10560 [Caulobacteraceae bacterium]|nr:hypothetical protein [Caulobacteraceae bacterium]